MGMYPTIHPFAGSEYRANLNSAAATTVIAVATNTGGLVIRNLSLTYIGGANLCTIFAGTAAPTAAVDTGLFVIASSLAGVTLAAPPLPLEIPAGYGIFAWAGDANFYLSLGYDLK